MNINRREFMMCGAAFACTGCADTARLAGARPSLRVGVLSDIHVTKPDNATWFEKALRKFDAERVDAVLVSGDLVTWSRRAELEAVAGAWRKVFPGDRRSDGVRVERLFVTGNHDVDGFAYPGAKCKSIGEARENSFFFNRDAMWREFFGEPYEPIKVKTVNGYSFVLRNWYSRLGGQYAGSPSKFPLAAGIPAEKNPAPGFVEGLSGTLPKDRPFFYVQHEPIPGTVVTGELDATGKALAAFPNCIALSGHTHFSLTDEHSIWQGAFTAVNCSCARGYLFTFAGRENGFSVADFGRNPPFEMPPLDIKRPKQGLVVDVWPDSVVFRRFDIENDVSLGADWVVPLCGGGRTVSGSGEQKYSVGPRREASRPPRFADGAQVSVAEVADGHRRNDKGTSADKSPRRQVVVSFPPARSAAGFDRGFDYSVTAELRTADFECVLQEKRVFSPNFCMAESMDVDDVTCAFAWDDIPKARNVRFVVRPFNCWGKRGEPIASEWMKFSNS